MDLADLSELKRPKKSGTKWGERIFPFFLAFDFVGGLRGLVEDSEVDEVAFGAELGDSGVLVVTSAAENSTSIGAARASRSSRTVGTIPAAEKVSYFAADFSGFEDSGVTAAPDNPTAQRAIPEPLEVHTYFYHQDHLGSTAITTDESGQIVELVDYDPFGVNTIYQKPQGDVYTGKYFYTGQEWDTWTRLYYYGARYYFNEIGKFYSVDPAGFWPEYQQRILGNPQGWNSYAYVMNNPMKYVDSTGQYWETIFDLISLAISSYDFNKDPSFWNGVFVALDIGGVVAPIPAVAGYVKNGARGVKIGNYFTKISSIANKSVFDIVELLVKHVNFNMNRRVWTEGEAGMDIANLVGHFAKHGDEVAAETLEQYYKKANDFIDNSSTYSFPDPNPRFPDDTIFYNPKTHEKVALDVDGKIKTYYIENKQAVLDQYDEIINN